MLLTLVFSSCGQRPVPLGEESAIVLARQAAYREYGEESIRRQEPLTAVRSLVGEHSVWIVRGTFKLSDPNPGQVEYGIRRGGSGGVVEVQIGDDGNVLRIVHGK